MGKLQYLIKKILDFFQFMVIKTLDPDRIQIRIGIRPKMPVPDQMNSDTKHCSHHSPNKS
jgi:hypothetical protein